MKLTKEQIDTIYEKLIDNLASMKIGYNEADSGIPFQLSDMISWNEDIDEEVLVESLAQEIIDILEELK